MPQDDNGHYKRHYYADIIRLMRQVRQFIGQHVKQIFVLSRLDRLPPNARLAVLCLGLAMLWLLSGLILPSGTQRIPPETIAARNARLPVMRVKTHLFLPSRQPAPIILRGYTEADRTVVLAAETSGTISELPIKKGNRVSAGDIICQIIAGVRRAKLEEAAALMEARQIDYEAANRLEMKGYASRSRTAAARAAYDRAVALYKQQQLELQRTRIRAPFDAILDDLPVEIGDLLTIGEPCATLVDKDPLVIVGQVAETQIGKLTIGASGTATLATGESVRGTLTYLAEKADPQTRTFRLEMELPNKDNRLRDGVSADIRIDGKMIEAHLLPHNIVILNTRGEIGVHRVTDNKIEFMPVAILSDTLDGILVTGLSGAVNLVTVGQDFVKHGQQVDATPDDAYVPPARAHGKQIHNGQIKEQTSEQTKRQASEQISERAKRQISVQTSGKTKEQISEQTKEQAK